MNFLRNCRKYWRTTGAIKTRCVGVCRDTYTENANVTFRRKARIGRATRFNRLPDIVYIRFGDVRVSGHDFYTTLHKANALWRARTVRTRRKNVSTSLKRKTDSPGGKKNANEIVIFETSSFRRESRNRVRACDVWTVSRPLLTYTGKRKEHSVRFISQPN